MTLLGKLKKYEAWRLAATLVLVSLSPRLLHAQGVAEVQVTPETMTLGVAEQQTIFAAAYDRRGNLIPDAGFSFWSSDTSVVRVTSSGVVLGILPGLAKVEARAQGHRASLAVLVAGSGIENRPPQGTVLTLAPPAPLVIPGETIRLTAQAVQEDGSPFALGPISWKSLEPSVAAVDSAGLVVGLAPGQSIIQAITGGGLMATAPVEVAAADLAVTPDQLLLAVGASDTLHVRVPAQGGRLLRQGIDWRTGDSGIVSVGADGIVQARAAGTTEIVAIGFGQERRARVVVHKIPEALIISPRRGGPIQLPRHGTERFSIFIEAADSTPIPEIGVDWTLRDTTTAIFDPATGTVTAKAIGLTTLTATVPGFAPVVWTIEVIPGLVRLRDRRVGVIAGHRRRLDAILTDAAGQPAGETSELDWISDRPEVAGVAADGSIIAHAPGRAAIIATAPWGHRDTALVFVTGDLLVTSDREGQFGLYTMLQAAPDTMFPVLQDGSANRGGVYAPDRTRIAFSSNRAGSYDLYVADADGANLRRVTGAAGDETDPVWLPDGTGLAYIATAPGAPPWLQTIALDGSPPRRMSIADSGSVGPAISPDGRTIAVVTTRGTKPDLYLVSHDGLAERRVTGNDQRELLPGFFPDGTLLYAEERGWGRRARVLRRSIAEDRDEKLFDIDQPLAALSVSPDGEWVAYAVGKVTAPGRNQAKFQLYLRPVAGDGKPLAVPLRPNEQIVHLAF